MIGWNTRLFIIKTFISMTTHEEQVEEFYSHGAEKRKDEADWFLSFWYRTSDTKDYYHAALNLLDYVMKKAKISDTKKILNVACGYGAETFRLYQTFHPELMYAIDITWPHIYFAQKKAKELGVDIVFEKKDACILEYPDNFFSLVFGIEWPAHFNPRKKFLEASYRVLQPWWTLVLTDIIVQTEHFQHSFFKKIIAKIWSYVWKMPRANRWGIDYYRHELEKIGYVVEYIQPIGDKVFPGFATNNLTKSSIKNAIHTRWFFVGMWLTMISWLLKFSYIKGYIDYLCIKATKPQ